MNGTNDAKEQAPVPPSTSSEVCTSQESPDSPSEPVPRPGRWATSVGSTRPKTAEIRRTGTRPATEPSGNTGVKVVEQENDFPFARVTVMRVGSAHVVVHDEQQELAAIRAMRSVSDQINAWFDPDARGEPVEIARK